MRCSKYEERNNTQEEVTNDGLKAQIRYAKSIIAVERKRYFPESFNMLTRELHGKVKKMKLILDTEHTRCCNCSKSLHDQISLMDRKISDLIGEIDGFEMPDDDYGRDISQFLIQDSKFIVHQYTELRSRITSVCDTLNYNKIFIF